MGLVVGLGSVSVVYVWGCRGGLLSLSLLRSCVGGAVGVQGGRVLCGGGGEVEAGQQPDPHALPTGAWLITYGVGYGSDD